MTDPAATPARPRPGATAEGYRWFAAGLGSWFGAWGMQQVMFSWLVVGELRADPEWVGVAQTSSMLPAIALLLVGGATADRRDPGRMLVVLHLLAGVPVLALAAGVAAGHLSLPGLIVYGLCMGTVMAFSIPARDSTLSRVAGDDLMQAVTRATIVQFASQGLGTLLAGGARWLGAPLTLCMQAAVLWAGAWATRHLPAAPPEPAPERRGNPVREATEGLRFVLRTPGLRAVLVLLCGVGLLFIGPFLVCFPLIVRDHYGGDIRQLSVVLMLFPLGTIAGSALILARGGIQRKGKGLLLALSCGACALIALGQGLPFWGFLLGTLLWGLAGSVFMNCSRTLFQQAAPAASRARVLAVNQLAFMGAGPVGSLLAGLISAQVGSLIALQMFGLAMLALVGTVTLFSRVTHLE